MAITFARPPINEVVIGLGFVPRSDLLALHFGDFWSNHLKSAYPGARHATPVANTTKEMPYFDPATGFPLPRMQLTDASGNRVVQLQQDRFYVNWRRTAEADQYVRFPAIKDEFDTVFRLFNEYVARTLGEPLKLVRYELTYVNSFRQGVDYAGLHEIGSILRDVSWGREERFLPSPTKFGVRFEFPLPNDMGKLAVAGDPAKIENGRLDAFRLQLAASADTEIVSRISFDDWVHVAHDSIVHGFKDLTTLGAHEHWGLVQDQHGASTFQQKE